MSIKHYVLYVPRPGDMIPKGAQRLNPAVTQAIWLPVAPRHHNDGDCALYVWRYPISEASVEECRDPFGMYTLGMMGGPQDGVFSLLPIVPECVWAFTSPDGPALSLTPFSVDIFAGLRGQCVYTYAGVVVDTRTIQYRFFAYRKT